jgi:hydrogenase maturation protease
MASAADQDTLILGVGNPLMGDDALGVLAIQELLVRNDLPRRVAVKDGGTEGLGLIPVMERFQRMIVVDAVPMGLPPGTIRRFTWDEVRLTGHDRVMSLHHSDLTDALILAEALGSLPPEVVFYGVQPHNTEWNEPLSEAVANALPALIDALLTEVRSEPYDGEEDFNH